MFWFLYDTLDIQKCWLKRNCINSDSWKTWGHVERCLRLMVVLVMLVLVVLMRASPKCVSWWLGGLVGR